MDRQHEQPFCAEPVGRQHDQNPKDAGFTPGVSLDQCNRIFAANFAPMPVSTTHCSRSGNTTQVRESKSQHGSNRGPWRLSLKVDGCPPPKTAGARLGDLERDDLYLGSLKRVDLDESTESHTVHV